MIPSLTFAFSCPFGKQAACLSASDKVCPLFARCVNHNSICISANTCRSGELVCGSDYDDLYEDYSQAIDDFNDLTKDYRQAIDKHNDLAKENNRLLSCIYDSNSLKDLKLCI